LKAQAEQKTQILRGIVLGTNTGKQTLDVVIQPIVAPDTLYGSVLVVFIDVPTALEPATKSTTSKRGKVSNVVSLENRTVEELEKELDRFRSLLGPYQRHMWACFENVVRHNEPAGIAGSQYANNPAQRIQSAKMITSAVACELAGKLGY
jgi:hypothetical protein